MPEVDEDAEQDDDDKAADFGRALKDYRAYFEWTWVGKLNPRTQKRGRPVFKLEHWNHYSAVMSDSPELTNNKSESFNSQMKITIPMKPNIFAILKGIQDEDSLSAAKFAACLAGNGAEDPISGRTKKYCKRQDKIKSLVSQYKSLPLKDYINALMAFFND